MNSEWIWFNGSPVSPDAVVSGISRGFLYGDGVFDTMYAFDGKAFMLKAHLERLRRAADFFSIPVTFSDTELSQAIHALIEKNDAASCAYIRITLSRGVLRGRGLGIPGDTSPEWVVIVRPAEKPSEADFQKGRSVIISSLPWNAESPVKRYKTLNMAEHILITREAHEKGADDAIILNTSGFVAEGITSNVFCVRNGRVFTPPLNANILPGITRSVVLDLCAENAISFEETLFDADFLQAASEIFLTNSGMGVMPVTVLESEPVGDGSEGPVARRIRGLYWERVHEVL